MKLNRLLLTLAALTALAVNASAAISIGVGGSATQDFATRPAATEWSTKNAPTDVVATTTTLDARVNTNSASTITTQVLDLSPTNLPYQNALAAWSSGTNGTMIGFLQTRPTGNGYTMLMATLQNNSGQLASDLTIAYTLAEQGTANAEEVAGHRVYYSLTGATGTWTPTSIDGTAGAKSVTVPLTGGWAAGATMYVLWVDDNGNAGTDRGYEIDDVIFTPTFSVIPLSCTLTAPTSSQSMVAPATVNVNATAGGSVPPTSVSIYTNDVLFYTSPTSPATSQLTALPAGVYAIHAVAANATETAYSVTNTITVTNVPLTVTLTAPANSTVLTQPANVPVTATSSGTIPATSVSFYTNDVLFYSTATAPYSNQLTALPIGTYAIHAVAGNGVETVYSATNTVTVRDPYVHYTGGTLLEDFNSMGSAGTVTPTGWYVSDTAPPTPINGTAVSVDNGSLGVSAVLGWNLGATGDPDRALGTKPTGTERNIAVRIQNNTGNGITSFEFRYDGELWRNYTNVYGILTNYVSYDGTTWTAIPFGFAQPVAPAPPMTALDGNLPANRTANIGGVVTPPATVAPGGVIYIRWQDPNDTGSDGALAIDNFSFTASSAATPVTITGEPTSVLALTNMPVTFTVIAAGSDLSYFWFHDNALVSTAGASYNIASVQTSDAGNYHVIVSNSLNSATSTVVSLTVTQQVGWVAFNDQVSPSAKVTDLSPIGPLAGPLTNVLFGNELPAYLTITPTTGAAASSGTMSAPLAGTPADTIFTPHVSWTGGNAGTQLRTTGLVTYVFTGLDTAKTYKFATTAVRGGTGGDYSNRWTQVELQGATAYTTNHTAGVITAVEYPTYLSGNQVAFNAGMNVTNLAGAPTGDVVQWDNIVPSAGTGNAPTNGTFRIVVRQYTNATPYMPGGITPVPAYTYGLGQIRLEESVSAPAHPQLTVVQVDATHVTVSWGVDAVGYTLQGNTGNVATPGDWSNIGTAITAAGSHMISFPPPDRSFFRLIK